MRPRQRVRYWFSTILHRLLTQESSLQGVRSCKNLNQVLLRKSFPDFLAAMNNKVDIKEWSEVGGTFHAARSVLRKFSPDLIVDVGCGKRPTLATMMALNYNTPVVAVDPAVSSEYARDIKRLTLEDMTLKQYSSALEYVSGSSVLVLANHAHCSKTEVRRFLSNYETWVYITVPCCYDNTLTAPGLFKEDLHMHTPKNKIYTQASDKKLLSEILGDL